MAAVTTVQEQGPHLHEGRTSFAAVATAVVLSRARTRRRENLRRSMSPVMPAEERREEAVLPEAMQRKLKTVAKQARSTSRTRRKKRLTLSSDANETTGIVGQSSVEEVSNGREGGGEMVREEEDGNTATGPKEQETDIVSVTIHNSDPPKAKVLINKIVVRVSFLDEQSSTPLKKSTLNRPVTSFYETHRPAVDYILPVLTGPAKNVSDRRGHMTLSWDESLIFNDRPSLLLKGDHTVILFELLLMSTLPSSCKPWSCMAWGYLRPAVVLRECGVGRPCRVQLYQPPRTWRRDNTPQPADLLGSVSPRPYSTSLHVSLATLDPSELPQQAFTRSFIPTLPEESHSKLEDLVQPTINSRSHNSILDTSGESAHTWSRLPGQPCTIPDKLRLTLASGNGGCVAVSFSPSGRLLAAACHHLNTFIIRLWQIPSFSEVRWWCVGKEMVYQLSWGNNEEWLAATCGSGLCHLWKVCDPSESEVLLSHPSYIYCVVFVNNIIVTGAFDGCLRCWANHKLQQVLSVHRGRVNTLSYDCHVGKVYSGDSNGMIGVWSVECGVDSDGDADLVKLNFTKEINFNELHGHSIQQLLLHPTQRKLLVHSLNNSLMMIDLRVWNVVQWYKLSGHTLSRPVGITITPCGGIILAGSPTHPHIHAWNCTSGKVMRTERVPGLQGPPITISYHPYEHLTAVSCLSPHQGVAIMEGTA